MAINKGYLTSKSNKESDNMWTPDYAIKPIIKYIPKSSIVWCPFDKSDSRYVTNFKEQGYKVIHSHIDDGKNFFEYTPNEYDVIVSNPPFSCKNDVIAKLYSLEKPFAILLPLTSLEGEKRYQYFKQGIQLLSFDKRVRFYMGDYNNPSYQNPPFSSAYFCRYLLPKDLIIEELIRE